MEMLTPRAFENCNQLTYLDLEHNNITALPDGLFNNSPQLAILNLNDNHIAAIGLASFTGTTLWYIDLQHNELSFFAPDWFTPVNASLTSLNLNGNAITYLPPLAFSTLRNLEELEIAANPIDVIPSDAFTGLTRLGYLAMYRCNIEELVPAWFTDLAALHSLHIENNAISDLPAGIFGPLLALNDINLSQNRLATIDSRAFGNVSAMLTFNAQFNQINAIDADFFDSASVLYILFLYGNTCASTNFINVAGTRELVRNQLQRCFENFAVQERGTVECDYVDYDDFGYHCEMSVVNPRGSDDFEGVAGGCEGWHDGDFFERIERIFLGFCQGFA
jgi:Leucine-rich repeat (LRR) protein